MNKILVAIALSLCSTSAFAMVKVEPKSPALGVVCDIYFCANSKGISIELTQKFLGKTVVSITPFAIKDGHRAFLKALHLNANYPIQLHHQRVYRAAPSLQAHKDPLGCGFKLSGEVTTPNMI